MLVLGEVAVAQRRKSHRDQVICGGMPARIRARTRERAGKHAKNLESVSIQRALLSCDVIQA